MPIKSLHEGRAMSKRAIRFGHVRLGEFNGKHPEQSTTFIFTSADPDRLKPLQRDFGGTIERYTPQGVGEEPWRVITEVEAFTALFPFPDLADNVSQSFELWRRMGIERSCEGPGFDCTRIERDEVTGEATETVVPCLCNPEKVECSATTRLMLLLPQTGLGAWELVTGSKIAAVHLWDQVRLVENVAAGHMNRVPIRLVYAPRQITYFDEKEQKRRTTTKRVVSLSVAGDAERVLSLVAAPVEHALLSAVRQVLGIEDVPALPHSERSALPARGTSEAEGSDGLAEGEVLVGEPGDGNQTPSSVASPPPPEDGPPSAELMSRARKHIGTGTDAAIARRVKVTYPEVRGFDSVTHRQLSAVLEEVLKS